MNVNTINDAGARDDEPSGASAIQGRLKRDELSAAVRNGTLDTVVLCMTDMQGRFNGKRLTGRFFVDSNFAGTQICNYLLATDMELTLIPGFEAASWESGYGDFTLLPDLGTLRRIDWLPGTALVLCDVVDSQRRPLAHSPRQMLQKQIARLADLGYVADMAGEFEFYLYNNTLQEARVKCYRQLEPSSWYPEDGVIFQTTRDEPVIRAIRNGMERSGIPIESSKGEWGPGQQEINLQYCEALEMADRSVIYKHGAKEIAAQHGKSATFMAKVDEQQAGSSFHIHVSLRHRDSGQSAFYDPRAQQGMSQTFRHFLAGAIANADAATFFWAPTINSYKRFRASTFAPTRLAWSVDNRTTGFRVLGGGQELRLECRVAGADANPYLAFSALLAAGIDGIDRQRELEPATAGNSYAATNLRSIPKSLASAVHQLDESNVMREAFGTQVVDHYVHSGRWEMEQFDLAVTDWERLRLFERG